MVTVSLLNFSFCPCIVFLILFSCLSVFSCSSLNFLKRIILNSLCDTSSVSISLESVVGAISFFWWFHIYLIFDDPWFLTYFSMHLSNWALLPDFTGLLWQRQFFTRQLSLGFWVCLLVMSLGSWGLLFWSVLGEALV